VEGMGRGGGGLCNSSGPENRLAQPTGYRHGVKYCTKIENWQDWMGKRKGAINTKETRQ
jgi:hypothetical protein